MNNFDQVNATHFMTEQIFIGANDNFLVKQHHMDTFCGNYFRFKKKKKSSEYFICKDVIFHCVIAVSDVFVETFDGV